VRTKQILSGKDEREQEITRVVNEVLQNCETQTLCTVTGDGIFPENALNFTEYTEQYACTVDEVSNIVNTAFSEIAQRILTANPSFKGLYTSGGDITVAVCKQFHTAGIRLLSEVLPLAAYGQFIQGDFDGLSIITKGGMVGDKGAIVQCISYLKNKLSSQD
jgi:uncharacterized protein YgbK (DUF1537 family)